MFKKTIIYVKTQKVFVTICDCHNMLDIFQKLTAQTYCSTCDKYGI